MALSSTAANISTTQDNGSATNQSNGATITYTPGGNLTFKLQSTSGIQRWTLQFECPSYPGLHQMVKEWMPGMNNAWTIQMPASAVSTLSPSNVLNGIVLYSTVSDGSGGSVVQSTYQMATTGGAAAMVLVHPCRGVVQSALGAYTNTNGVIVENANGAIGTIDGLTIAVGDVLFLPPGIAAAAADVGLYQVVAVGGASAKFQLNRVADMSQGAVIPTGTEIHVTEGTLMGGTQWVLTTTGIVTVGTTAQAWFPRQVTQSVTLVAGTKTIANVPLVSTTQCNVAVARTTPNTTASTITYQPIGGFTAGALGTATFNIQAAVAAGTINAADISTLTVTVFNQV